MMVAVTDPPAARRRGRDSPRWLTALAGLLPPGLVLGLTLLALQGGPAGAAGRTPPKPDAALQSPAGEARGTAAPADQAQALRRQLREYGRRKPQGAISRPDPAPASHPAPGSRLTRAERKLLHQQLRQTAREQALRPAP